MRIRPNPNPHRCLWYIMTLTIHLCLLYVRYVQERLFICTYVVNRLIKMGRAFGSFFPKSGSCFFNVRSQLYSWRSISVLYTMGRPNITVNLYCICFSGHGKCAYVYAVQICGKIWNAYLVGRSDPDPDNLIPDPPARFMQIVLHDM